MKNYYFYILKLETEVHEEYKYYVGKTYKLEDRMTNHYRGNNKSSARIQKPKLNKNNKNNGGKPLVVKEVIALYLLDTSILEGVKNDSELDSITSIVENKITYDLFSSGESIVNAQENLRNIDFKYENVRGGCFLDYWIDSSGKPIAIPSCKKRMDEEYLDKSGITLEKLIFCGDKMKEINNSYSNL
ncbi:hypothetical protein [Vagococcus fessus]|uniref:GIY-YIG domain-containing protein n=1 Tax=Vagococcus fessus TaxID=120370 RepID=A0A430A7M0_9ENTE|nr:hypothetical protein [Vagococcus fessus]RSU03071.1 hypothetical protein CBF31_04970 [Vagococcus fessus]